MTRRKQLSETIFTAAELDKVDTFYNQFEALSKFLGKNLTNNHLHARYFGEENAHTLKADLEMLQDVDFFSSQLETSLSAQGKAFENSVRSKKELTTEETSQSLHLNQLEGFITTHLRTIQKRLEQFQDRIVDVFSPYSYVFVKDKDRKQLIAAFQISETGSNHIIANGKLFIA